MSTHPNGTASSNPESPRKLKILMLHGYTQSGPLFHSKTRALEKLLHKAFPPASSSKTSSGHHTHYPGDIELIYPTAPLALKPADIPGFIPTQLGGSEASSEDAAPTAFGWWTRETGSGLYHGLSESLSQIAALIRSHGGIDGVLGFSQGGAFAALIASLLEPGRKEAFTAAAAAAKTNSESLLYPYPEEWNKLRKDFFPHHSELKFCAIYSGFFAPHPVYSAFYNPKIQTRTIHFIGSLDTVVEESRAMALVDATVMGEGQSVLVTHPGGHFVPVGKEMAGVLIGFVKDCLLAEERVESTVEDMEVSF